MKFQYLILFAICLSTAFAQTSPVDELLSRHERELEKRLFELDIKFDKALMALRERLIASGKIDDAIKVDNVLRQLLSQFEVTDQVWEFTDNRERIKIKQDGGFFFPGWKIPGKWELEGSIVKFTNHRGEVSQLIVTGDRRGQFSHSDGRKREIIRIE